MQRVDFYFHDGCPSHPSLLSLARDIATLYPAWAVALHPLSENDLAALGLRILPTVTINGVRVAAGMPSREWLLETIRMCDQ